MATDSIDPVRIITARGHDLVNHRLRLILYETERWGEIITALEKGRTNARRTGRQFGHVRLSETDGSEFDVPLITADGVCPFDGATEG